MNIHTRSSTCLLILLALAGCAELPGRTLSRESRPQPASNGAQRPHCDVPDPPPGCDAPDPGDPPLVDPFGVLSAVETGRQEIFHLSDGQTFSLPAIARFSGWARDRDATGPIGVRLTHNGTVLKVIDANQAGAGNQSGHYFADSASWTPVVGPNALCATAVNTGAGQDQLLGCQSWDIDTPPTLPVILDLDRAGPNVSVRWQDRSANEQHFFVQRYVSGSGYSAIASVPALAGTGTVTSTADTTSAPDDPRCYRLQVLSVFHLIYGPDSCLPKSVPSPPVITDLIPAAATMSLWFTVAHDNAVDFRFERRTPDGAWADAGLGASGQAGGARSAIDRTVAPQSVYCYRVIASNRFGESAGAEACKQTLRVALPTPTDLRITARSPSSLGLAWTDQAVDETSYQVIYRVKDAASSEPIVTLPAHPGTGAMAFELRGLRPGTEYCASVMARAPDAEEGNAASVCGWTEAVASIRAFTASPPAVQVCAARQVTLSWDVASATRLVISRNGIAIHSRDAPAGGASWQGSFTDPDPQDGTQGNLAYSLQAEGAGGSTASQQAGVSAFSDFPIASGLVFVNRSSRGVVLQRMDGPSTWTDLQSVPAQHYVSIAFERCSTIHLRAVDPAGGTVPWEMGGRVLGFPGTAAVEAEIR